MFDRLKSGLKGLVTKVTTTELTNESLDPILSEFTMNLAENDVAFSVIDRICDDLKKRLVGLQVKRLEDRKKIVEENLRQVLLEIMVPEKDINLLEKIEEKKQKKEPFVLLFVGINGTGKTTTIAKIANFLRNKGHSVVLAGADTYRAGSIEQLEEHGRRLGLRVIKHDYGGDPAAVAYDAINHAKAHGVNVVLQEECKPIRT
jgi:fused signal recognition particle receptor